MAATVENVDSFLNKLRNEVWEKYNRDIKMLIQRYNLSDMKPWDLTFYSEKYKQETCDFNIKEFEKYFEYEPFLARFLKFLEELYNIEIKQIEATKWHDTVKCFSIT